MYFSFCIILNAVKRINNYIKVDWTKFFFFFWHIFSGEWHDQIWYNSTTFISFSGLDERPFKRNLVMYLFLHIFLTEMQSVPAGLLEIRSCVALAESLQKDAVVRPWSPFRLDGHTYIIISACCWLAATGYCRLNWLLRLNHGRVKRRLIVNVLLYTAPHNIVGRVYICPPPASG